MSSDLSQFVPPRYPSPPRNLWYNVPNQEAPKQIFPWEAQQPKPARIFVGDQGSPKQKATALEEPATPTTAATTSEAGERRSATRARFGAQKTEACFAGTPFSRNNELSEPNTPTMRGIHGGGVGADWQAFTRSNAWDDVPEINEYVSGMQPPRKQQASLAGHSLLPTDAAAHADGDAEDEHNAPPIRFRALRVTDFPGDRPSLPVTPAPVRRDNYWGSAPMAADGEQRLPTAEGVPAQAEWVSRSGGCGVWEACLTDGCMQDPAAQLQKLANAQGEILKRLESSRDVVSGGAAVATLYERVD
jgi:glycogenin glucosyltransferase